MKRVRAQRFRSETALSSLAFAAAAMAALLPCSVSAQIKTVAGDEQASESDAIQQANEIVVLGGIEYRNRTNSA